MGTSNWQNIPFCINAIRRIQPKKILDAGAGFGRWGILCREFLETWSGRVNRDKWEIRIDSVEIFKPNIDEYHKIFYSNIYNKNIVDFISQTEIEYDLIMLGDVIEHLEKKDALNVLKLCLKNSGYVILNLPLGKNWQQGEVYGNPYERHLSFWKTRDIEGKNCIHYKTFRDYIGRKFGSFVLSENFNDMTFIKRRTTKLKFFMDGSPYAKSIFNKIRKRTL